ncbi:MAG: serine/threonine protein kinase, partial [Chloroflexaceae bacterium]|nr:serine/threonine protein kinase [Chloroflexaceae bacterium]
MTTTLNNRYRIEKTLGRGGFGQTFLASDTHMPSGRQCVIKQLQPAVQDPATERWILDCFQREAATLEELGEAHPQIPCLYAYFAEAGQFFLVQEYIPGPTLQQKVRDSGPFSESAVCSLLADILPVLDFVHSRRIIHRDIKPDNIILREKDGKPVLIDFGAVKEAIATVYDNHGRTNHSVAVGTPGYMASEQAAGRPVFSSDLYSLGLTVIYLLTGKHPGQLQADPRTGEILWESETPRLSRALVAVLDRATRFHPRDRYASAREMLEALEMAAVPSAAATWVAAPP